MNRRQFTKHAAALPLAGSALYARHEHGESAPHPREAREIYEFRRYHMVFRQPQQELEKYFEEALIPALNRLGVEHVGVFTELGLSTPAVLYVLIAYPGIDSFYMAPERLAADEKYRDASASFESRSSQDAVYARYDTWILSAFDGLKHMVVPDTSGDRIFELRTYEGHNDDAVTRKTAMFDKEELDLFFRTKLHPVFFGKMIRIFLKPTSYSQV
jgi:hypothetical protein